jgi:hypothetical protein
MNVNVEEFCRCCLEEVVPERGKMEICVSKEKKSDFEVRVFGREVKEFGGV